MFLAVMASVRTAKIMSLKSCHRCSRAIERNYKLLIKCLCSLIMKTYYNNKQ